MNAVVVVVKLIVCLYKQTMCDDSCDEIHARILEDGYQLCLKMLLDDDDKNSNLVKCLMEGAPMHRNIITLALQHRVETGGVFDKFISAKALKIVETLSMMDTETVELMIGDFSKLITVTIETFENAEVNKNSTCKPASYPEPQDRTFYIGDFIGGNYCFDIGERIVDVYVCDDTHARTKFYRSVVKFQKEMGVELNEEYLKQILPEILFENYLRIKEKYLHGLTLGDSYDQSENFLAYFEAEATAMRAYLLKVTQLMYARGHLFNEPIPHRLSSEIYRFCPRDENDDRSPGEGWDHYHRDVGRVLMNIPNRYTELDDD